MFSEDSVMAQVRHWAVEHNTDGDTNECQESLLRLAFISDTTFFSYSFNMYADWNDVEGLG